MGTKYVTKEETEEIIRLSETKSEYEIAKMFGRTQSGIHLILRRNGIKRKKSRLNMSSLKLDINYFKEINTPDKAYWLGFICADGNITKNENKVALISKDLEVIKGFKRAIGAEHKISTRINYDKRTNKSYTGYSIQIGNELFVKNLINVGVGTNKTDVLNFPAMRKEYKRYFIAGLFDGDGSVSVYKNGNVRINLISTKEILDHIDMILISIGITPLKRVLVSPNKKNVWKMHLYKDAIKFLDYIYGDSNFKYLTRKYSRYVENI